MASKVASVVRGAVAITMAVAGAAAPAIASASDWKTVTDERLLNSAKDGNDWLVYGKNYNGDRFSPLNQITTKNVKKLSLAWSYSLGTNEGQQLTPIVNNGIMIMQVSNQWVEAVDLRTKERIWRYEIKLPADIGQFTCCGLISKGVSVYEDKVYFTTLDAHVVALDAKTGKKVWEQTAEDYKGGYSMTMAPVIVKGKVMIGLAGGEYGVTGQIVAYDFQTGKELWRTITVPQPGEPGNETWGNESWKYGGAAAWLTATYDPATNLVYWGTGNPAPWNYAMRPGDNRGANSMLALDADTGKKVWDFQFTSKDAFDFDSVWEGILVDLDKNGKKVKGLVQANKNGHLYTLDRTSGQFNSVLKFFEKANWGKVDPVTGRSEVDPSKLYAKGKESTVCPTYFGAKGLAHMSVNPQRQMAFIPVVDLCYHWTHEEASYKRGVMYLGIGGEHEGPGKGEMQGVDLKTNKIVWRWPNKSPLLTSSVLSTAGDLIFFGSFETEFRALDATTGKEVWNFPVSSSIVGAPVSFMMDGKQYVAVVSGLGGSFTLWAGKAVPEHLKKINRGATLWVFALKDD
jgi:alcohol dehydrogenase (cytochrome c)